MVNTEQYLKRRTEGQDAYASLTLKRLQEANKAKGGNPRQSGMAGKPQASPAPSPPTTCKNRLLGPSLKILIE